MRIIILMFLPCVSAILDDSIRGLVFYRRTNCDNCDVALPSLNNVAIVNCDEEPCSGITEFPSIKYKTNGVWRQFNGDIKSLNGFINTYIKDKCPEDYSKCSTTENTTLENLHMKTIDGLQLYIDVHNNNVRDINELHVDKLFEMEKDYLKALHEYELAILDILDKDRFYTHVIEIKKEL